MLVCLHQHSRTRMESGVADVNVVHARSWFGPLVSPFSRTLMMSQTRLSPPGSGPPGPT